MNQPPIGWPQLGRLCPVKNQHCYSRSDRCGLQENAVADQKAAARMHDEAKQIAQRAIGILNASEVARTEHERRMMLQACQHISDAAKTLRRIEAEFIKMAKKPTVVKKLKGIPIGSYAEVKDAAGKSTIKPKVKRKTSVSQKIAQRKSKKVSVRRRTV